MGEAPLSPQEGGVVPPESRLVSHATWEILHKDKEGEGHVTLLHGYRYDDTPAPEGIENVFITQAEPTQINYSPASPVQRDHELIAVVPDIQYGFRQVDEVFQPLHNQQALDVARLILADLRPDLIVLQGDLMDFSEVSRYEADSPHFASTLQVSLNGLHKYLASLRADNPQSRIVGLEGNHEARLSKTILRHNAQLAGIKRANIPEEWNLISLPFLLRFDELGIEWYSGYPANEYRYSDNLTFVHGQAVRSSGSSAAKYSADYPDTNVIFGHIHRQESHSRTTRNGEHLQAQTFGTLSSIEGAVPSYHNGVDNKSKVVKRFENWQVGLGIIRAYQDGYLEIQPVRIKDGVARINGKEYAGG